MKTLKKLLANSKDFEDYDIVVTQDKRITNSVGNEENLHWPLIVLTQPRDQTGPLWRAVDHMVLTEDGQGVEVWHIDVTQNATLWKTTKCLGSMILGKIKPDELHTLSEVLFSIIPPAKADRPEWNCRDYVMEAIGLLKTKGWVDSRIVSLSSLLPSLKKAAAETDKAMKAGKTGSLIAIIVVLDLVA